MAEASFTTTPGALLRRFLRAAAAEASAFAAAAGVRRHGKLTP